MAATGTKNGMHVVRHDAPSHQFIPLPVEMPQRAVNTVCSTRIPQHARTMTGIKIRFNASGVELAEAPQLRISEFASHLLCCQQQMLALEFPLLKHMLWQ